MCKIAIREYYSKRIKNVRFRPLCERRETDTPQNGRKSVWSKQYFTITEASFSSSITTNIFGNKLFSADSIYMG